MNTTSGNTIDIDIYGKENQDGSAVEYVNSAAISNALKLFLSSKRGDFLYSPSSGGILDSQVFKVMTQESMTMLQFNIRNAITNFFSPSVRLLGIDITPMYDEHALEINVKYYTADSNIERTTVYVNADFHIKHFEYTDVDYEGQNLLSFCQLTKSDMTGQYLEMEPNTETWVWGPYRFINFDFDTDPYAEDILLICNS